MNRVCVRRVLALGCLVVAGCGAEADPKGNVAIAGSPGMIRIAEVTTGYVNILPAEVKGKIDAGGDLAIVDVRAVSQYHLGHLAGAISMPLATLPWAMGRLDRDKELVVYCQVGDTSIGACKLLVEAGFSNVKNMVGGISAWPYEQFIQNPTSISI